MMSFMFQTSAAEFRQIMKNEFEARWPRWKYSAAVENDFYAVLKDFTIEQIKQAVQKYSTTEFPKRPELIKLKKYLPKPKQYASTPKLKKTPQQYRNGFRQAKIETAIEAIRNDDQNMLEFLRKIDPDIIKQAKEKMQISDDDYSDEILGQF